MTPPNSDEYYSNPALGPGPVHVLRVDDGTLTRCGLLAIGLLYNHHGGPTNCEACKVAVVEEALRGCTHPSTGATMDRKRGGYRCLTCGEEVPYGSG